jgi:hypothetical protein
MEKKPKLIEGWKFAQNKYIYKSEYLLLTEDNKPPIAGPTLIPKPTNVSSMPLKKKNVLKN